MGIVMKTVKSDHQETPFRRWWNSRTFVQQRLIRFCLSMLMMVICFPLYYMGLFGTVEGPLNPSRLGDVLAGMGVTQTHILMFFIFILAIAVTWNWIYNLVCLGIGSRLTCRRETNGRGAVCGAAVRRSRILQRKTGERATQYVCVHGHKRADAHFHPVKKGAASHALWAILLSFAVIVYFF